MDVSITRAPLFFGNSHMSQQSLDVDDVTTPTGHHGRAIVSLLAVEALGNEATLILGA